MADPVFVNCPKDIWTKIATNVISGTIHAIYSKPKYLQTYRSTGGAAPTLITDGVRVFKGDIEAEISAGAGIDVYIWCQNADGRVRVDL